MQGNTSIRSLDVHHVVFQEQDLQALAEMLQHNKTLRALRLSQEWGFIETEIYQDGVDPDDSDDDNDIIQDDDEEGLRLRRGLSLQFNASIEPVLRVLASQSPSLLQTLVFHGVRFSNPDVRALANVLQHNDTLQEIGVEYAGIKNAHAICLCRALCHNSTLKVFDLLTGNADITIIGTTRLAQSLKYNSPCLVRIGLVTDCFKRTGFTILLEALKFNITIQEDFSDGFLELVYDSCFDNHNHINRRRMMQ
eukprot:CAMPEP_0118699116 /NCGR_PEP_ID=MMETSP0800-20121206/15673_1 /TAXON_ID=210618 ORGANISM="Striatella unipunctata, Strain CCMP2910" /NCGR_SAMPLE_ID=MMETSP0800 /ASSEMBLY_ACC=CAM_ASM_000638 /LENGTH=250 /DNA_ID=CAMNT_0006599203 /DNA_START=366 /DNA_END=1118 /DNA_ORIENTATION=+